MKITSIEITESAIRIATVHQGWSSSMVEAYMEQAVPAGETSQQILSTLAPGFSSSKDIVMNIPRRYVFMKIIEMPLLKDADLKKALEYEVEEHIPYPIQNVVYDFCVIQQAEKTRILLVAVPKAVVESYLESVKEIKADSIAVSVSSLALLNLCLQQERGKDWILCHREKECTEIFVVRDGCLSLVYTIQEQSEIIKTIREYSTGKIILTGEDSRQLRIKSGETAAEELTLPDSIRWAPQIKYTSPVPIALALNNLSSSGLKINLHPEKGIQVKKELNKQIKTTILLLILIIFCINLLFLIHIKKMENALQLTKAEINRIQPKVAGIIDNKTSLEQFTKNVEKLNKVTLDTPCYLDILNKLTLIVPTGTQLESVNIKESQCRITGWTPSITALLTAIEKSSAFEQVEIVGGITREMNLERFEIRMLGK
ncbi:MAG: pilus assembly protein PilM [Candidatus Desantisbacteria bacterium]